MGKRLVLNFFHVNFETNHALSRDILVAPVDVMMDYCTEIVGASGTDGGIGECGLCRAVRGVSLQLTVICRLIQRLQGRRPKMYCSPHACDENGAGISGIGANLRPKSRLSRMFQRTVF